MCWIAMGDFTQELSWSIYWMLACIQDVKSEERDSFFEDNFEGSNFFYMMFHSEIKGREFLKYNNLIKLMSPLNHNLKNKEIEF